MGIFVSGGLQVLFALQVPQASAVPRASAVPQAAVTGAVRDGVTGAGIAGAVVTLTDLDRATATDARGRYLLRDVPPGPQHVSFRSLGHAPQVLDALVPSLGRLQINVDLHPTPHRLRTIEVRRAISLRGLDGGDGAGFSDRGSSIAAIRNHPLLAEPDVLQALGGGDVVLQPESPSGVHVRGGASDQTAYLLDGIPVFSPYHAAGMFSAWNPDAVSRLELSSSAPSPAYPGALSGAVTAMTRAPGATLRAQGSLSTTQARVTFDGPLGAAGTGSGAGFLVSWRSGFPGHLIAKNEGSYLRGGSGDRLVKLEAPVLHGRLRLLGYDSDDEIDAASGAEGQDPAGQPSHRNRFDWHSRSLGAEWTRGFSNGADLRVLAWSAASDAGSSWTAEAGRVGLAATRRDEGILATVERGSARVTTVAGVRIERGRTAYRISPESADGPAWAVAARTPVATAFARQTHAIGRRLGLEAGASLVEAAGDLYMEPRARLQWNPEERLTFSASYARLHQFAQSLRNPESVVGNIFPVDLYLGAGAPGVPAARSDLGVIAADYRPAAGLRLGLQAYLRGFDGLLLVAPSDGEPFATSAFATGGPATGSGTARGVSLDLAFSTARYGLLASYGWQRVRLASGSQSYVPEHGATHVLEGGVIVFPTASTSVRLGVAGMLGRRATIATGDVEWEACTLLDRGCEFGGSPQAGESELGATPLPAYWRVDLGVRKHLHLEIGGRDFTVALFGTATNVLNRKNVLTYARNPATGELAGIIMRPLAPLVAGLDWQF